MPIEISYGKKPGDLKVLGKVTPKLLWYDMFYQWQVDQDWYAPYMQKRSMVTCQEIVDDYLNHAQESFAKYCTECLYHMHYEVPVQLIAVTIGQGQIPVDLKVGVLRLAADDIIVSMLKKQALAKGK